MMMQESENAIAKLAYAMWEAEGRPDGRALDHWLRAERQLQAVKSRPHPSVGGLSGVGPRRVPVKRTTRSK